MFKFFSQYDACRLFLVIALLNQYGKLTNLYIEKVYSFT